MKTALLYCTVASTLGLAWFANVAPMVSRILAPTPGDHSPLALGALAVTGRLDDLQAAIAATTATAPAIPSPAAVPPVTSPAPVVVLPVAVTVAPKQRIVAAWGDEAGRVFCRFEDGTTARRLASGDLVPMEVAP